MVAPPPRRSQQSTSARYASDKARPAPDHTEGRFTFTSAAAQEAWDRRAYRQAVDADKWHLGDEMDERTRDAILADIGGATAPIYQGPDGKYRFQNARTMEDTATRSHRAAHFAGKTMDQIAAASMPGEEEFVAARRAARGAAAAPVAAAKPANDNLIAGLNARTAAASSAAVPMPVVTAGRPTLEAPAARPVAATTSLQCGLVSIGAKNDQVSLLSSRNIHRDGFRSLCRYRQQDAEN